MDIRKFITLMLIATLTLLAPWLPARVGIPWAAGGGTAIGVLFERWVFSNRKE